MYLQSIPCASQNPVKVASGLGCAGLCCGGGCGLGLFDSGLDYTQWGIPEYATILGGAYLLFSVFFTTKRGTQAVRKTIRKHRRRRAALQGASA
jgi:hypothetical protein